jgi:hypothetical protein
MGRHPYYVDQRTMSKILIGSIIAVICAVATDLLSCWRSTTPIANFILHAVFAHNLPYLLFAAWLAFLGISFLFRVIEWPTSYLQRQGPRILHSLLVLLIPFVLLNGCLAGLFSFRHGIDRSSLTPFWGLSALSMLLLFATLLFFLGLTLDLNKPGNRSLSWYCFALCVVSALQMAVCAWLFPPIPTFVWR